MIVEKSSVSEPTSWVESEEGMAPPSNNGIVLTPSDSAKTLIKDGWFAETEAMWPGQKMCLEVEEVLENGRSLFQDILMFKSKTYGNVLILDGVIQVTQRDEHSYQEMITNLPMFAHPNPKKVLIVGGGDGGVAREVLKHECVEQVIMCEIDEQVCEVSKKYLPDLSDGAFDDPRLKLIIDDAAKYLRDEGPKEQFDVIICDSSDPVGPAEVLFKPEFFESMKNALGPQGVLSTQGECLWLHLDLISKVINETRDIFSPSGVKYGFTTIPTYPSGQIGFMIATKDGSNDVSLPKRAPDATHLNKLKYYSEAVHKASFVLPSKCPCSILLQCPHLLISHSRERKRERLSGDDEVPLITRYTGTSPRRD